MSYVAGIDLGGTKIEGIILNESELNKPLCRVRVPTERNKGYDHILSQIDKLCGLLSKEAGLPFPEKVGMGTPGAVDPLSRTLKNSNTQCMNGRNLHEDLKQVTHRDFVIANDANCFALAEAKLGSAKLYETVYGVIMGTGVGGGFVVGGHLLHGCHGIAGEWGQLMLDADVKIKSSYGTHGTVEAILCGPSLETFYEQHSGVRRPLREVIVRARNGSDAAASATLRHLTDYFAKSMSILINTVDPHAIVLGGGVGNIDELYGEAVRQEIVKYIANSTFEAALLKPALGDSAGVFGAAMLVCN